MPSFDFKLEGLLRQRTHAEQEKQRILAEKQRALSEIQDALKRLQESVELSNNNIRQNHLVGRLNMEFLAAHRRFLAGMQRQGLASMQRMALAQRAVDEARQELATAAKNRKVIEKLREKKFKQWRANLARREQSELDEIGMQLAYQNLSEGSEGSAAPNAVEPTA